MSMEMPEGVHLPLKNDSSSPDQVGAARDQSTIDTVREFEAIVKTVAAARDQATLDTVQQKCEELQRHLELAREQLRLLEEEQEVEREPAGDDPRVQKLKEEYARMNAASKKLCGEIDALKKAPPPNGKRCPHCGSRDTRLSRRRGVEKVFIALLIRPYRCRMCQTRFWRFR
jgi:hypothetical protein